MIQSRGQFGFYGAVLVFAASIVLDVGFLAAQLVIQADAMNLLISNISTPAWIAILVVPVVVLTVFGYDWIHRFQRVMTPILAVTFVVVLIQAIAHGAPTGAAAATTAPSFPAFMAATGLFVMTEALDNPDSGPTDQLHSPVELLHSRMITVSGHPRARRAQKWPGTVITQHSAAIRTPGRLIQTHRPATWHTRRTDPAGQPGRAGCTAG